MVVHEITDCLDPAPTRWSLAKQVPGHLGKSLGVAVAAPQEKNQRLFRQFLDGMLSRGGCNNIGLTRVLDQRRARYLESPGGGDETRAPVAEAITIGPQGKSRVRRYVIRKDDVGCARIVDVQHQHHGRRPRTIVDQLVAHSDFQARSPRDEMSSTPNNSCTNREFQLVRKLAILKGQSPGRATLGRWVDRGIKYPTSRAKRNWRWPFPLRRHRSDGDLDVHSQVVGRRPHPGTMERYCLVRIAHHRDPNEVAVTNDAIGWIEIYPAGSGQIDLSPGVRVAAANVGFVVVSGDVQISGDEACGHPKGAHSL